MRSIWSINDIQKKDKREPLPEHISAAVIGGGMAGILCAWFLMESGVDTAVSYTHLTLPTIRLV